MKAHRSRRVLVLAAVLGLAAACSNPPMRPTYPDIHFTDRPPIQLDVARIELETTYQPPFKLPNVDHQFPIQPSRALENWARDRLKPVGRDGRAVFAIRDASVVEIELPKEGGISGALTTAPAQRYDMRLEATVQILDRGGSARTATVQATRSQSVLEGITPNERDQAWYSMTQAAMADFDRQMESEIRNNFGNFVVR